MLHFAGYLTDQRRRGMKGRRSELHTGIRCPAVIRRYRGRHDGCHRVIRQRLMAKQFCSGREAVCFYRPSFGQDSCVRRDNAASG